MKTLYEIIDSYPDYFGLDKFQELLSCSDSTARRILKKNLIAATNVGNIYYFKKSDVKKFLEEYVL